MKITMKSIAELWLALVLTCSVTLGQTDNTKPAAKEAVSTSQFKEDELRQHQLRVLREHVLSRTLESIKKMDEAGLRLSARNQLLAYLTGDQMASDNKQTLTTQLAVDALTDLRDYAEDIDPFMFSYLSTNLGTWLQKYRPNLTEDFEKAIKAHAKVDASQRIGSLFQLDGGDVLAAKRIRQELEEHGELNGLHFWLAELMLRKSKQFEPVASDVVGRAEQGQLSFETLFWVSDIYLNPQISDGLRNRFLAMVVARTQPPNFIAGPAPQMAYDLLTKILPFVQRSVPELSDQAMNQHVAMRASLSERQVTSEARLKRLKESANPIEDLISEAESDKSTTHRNELLLEAAQMALEKKRFGFCLDILTKVNVDVAATAAGSWQESIDYILKSFVRIVLVETRVELAEKGAARISSSLTRVEAMSLIVRYWFKAGDKPTAQRVLIEASKVAASTANETHKAKAFFLLSLMSDQVDVTKKPELLLSGINALNSLAKPDDGARDKSAYQRYVQRLDNAGYELIRGFKGLTRTDQNSALAMVEKLQKPDLRTFALIGILEGL